MPPILKEGKTYTFLNYFDRDDATGDILAVLGSGGCVESLDCQLKVFTPKASKKVLKKNINALTLLSDLQAVLATRAGTLERG